MQRTQPATFVTLVSLCSVGPLIVETAGSTFAKTAAFSGLRECCRTPTTERRTTCFEYARHAIGFRLSFG